MGFELVDSVQGFRRDLKYRHHSVLHTTENGSIWVKDGSFRVNGKKPGGYESTLASMVAPTRIDASPNRVSEWTGQELDRLLGAMEAALTGISAWPPRKPSVDAAPVAAPVLSTAMRDSPLISGTNQVGYVEYLWELVTAGGFGDVRIDGSTFRTYYQVVQYDGVLCPELKSRVGSWFMLWADSQEVVHCEAVAGPPT